MRMTASHAAAAATLALLPACGRETTAPGAQDVQFTVEQVQVATASNAFGFGLLRRVAPTGQNPNVLISPLSITMALGMALNGAVGQTYDDMHRTLGFDDMAPAEVNAAYRGLLDGLVRRDPGVRFTIANSAWYERTFEVHASFLDAVEQNFDAHVAALDFRDPGAPGVINDWVSARTGGRIEDIIQSINPLDVMFLVNATYFRAPWSAPFEEAGTRDGDFTRLDGTTVSVPLMNHDATHPQHVDEDVQVVELLYADSAYSMVLAAPREAGDFAAFLDSLTPERWNTWMSELQPGRILLTMPRFRFEWGEQLNAPLEAMGMGIAFRPYEADFTGIADVEDLHISRVIHDTFIDVDEEGTEAAAATVVTISVTSLPPEVRFDRPFAFAIRERSTGTILFLGVLGAP